MKSYSIIARRLGSVFASVSGHKTNQKTLQYFYISDEKAKHIREVNNVPSDTPIPMEITSKLAEDWFEHLNKMAENPDNRGLCIELEILFKRSSLSYFPLFFTLFHEMEKVISSRRSKMVIFKEFLISRYEIKTEEEFKEFVDLVVKEMCYRMVSDNHYSKIIKDKMNFIGLPVEDVNGLKEFFYNVDIEELNKKVPVYFDKGYTGTTEEFIQLPEEELIKHRLGTCFGLVLTSTFGSEEFIAGNFKPNEKCLSYQFLKDYYDEEIRPNKVKLYKPKYFAKLIPVFETEEGKKVLKMLVFKLVV